MSSEPRIHIGRRGRAIDRLRTMTTGTAVAGVAGTAAFGLLAAATWSGDPTATSAADLAPNVAPYLAPDSDEGSSRAASPEHTDRPQAVGQGPTRIQVTPGTGRSHATTGGSH